MFLIAAYLLNGGSAGRDFLTRYFAICAVVALWIAVPFQTLILFPHIIPKLTGIDWYNPTVAQEIRRFATGVTHVRLDV